jgi:hypothetical protein
MNNFSVEYNGKVEFGLKTYLKDCTVITDLGSVECDIIVVPKDSFKAMKEHLEADGTVTPSKGTRSIIGTFGQNGQQAVFQEDIGLSLTVIKLNNKAEKKASIFATE